MQLNDTFQGKGGLAIRVTVYFFDNIEQFGSKKENIIEKAIATELSVGRTKWKEE